MFGQRSCLSGSILCVCCFLLVLANIAPLQAENVSFADPNLEAGVRYGLNIPQGQPITTDEMTGLFYVGASGVSSLQGLQCATNLTALRISTTSSLDLSPLSDLSQIGSLNIENDGTGNINLLPLSGLASLQTATFTGPLSNISALGYLKLLGDLSFRGASLNTSDLQGIAQCASLHTLRFYGGSIQDISPLSLSKHLAELTISSTPWNNLAQLNGFTNLNHLDFSNTGITDLSSMPTLPGVSFLYLSGDPVHDLSPLNRLPQLVTLGLSGTGISDLSQVALFANLRDLALDDNHIIDISPLSSLRSLQVLSLGFNDILDLEPLRGMNDLELLDLSGNDISNLEPISQDPISTLLGLEGNPLDANAFNSYIPQLQENNPHLSIVAPEPGCIVFLGISALARFSSGLSCWRRPKRVRPIWRKRMTSSRLSFILLVLVAMNPCESVLYGSDWTGAVSYDWGTPGNWLYNTIPGPGDYAFVDSGAYRPDVIYGINSCLGLFINGMDFRQDSVLTIEPNGGGLQIDQGTYDLQSGQLTVNGTTIIGDYYHAAMNNFGGSSLFRVGRAGGPVPRTPLGFIASGPTRRRAPEGSLSVLSYNILLKHRLRFASGTVPAEILTAGGATDRADRPPYPHKTARRQKSFAPRLTKFHRGDSQGSV